MKSLSELKEFFKMDRFVSYNGIEIISCDGETSSVKAAIGDSALNAGDSVQGGMLFTIADFAFAVLANCIHPVTVTSSATITYLAACRDTAFITASSKEISRHRHNCVHEVTVCDDKGKVVCVAMMNGFIKE